jgi:DNA-directed RNA polymerase specialized sigma24 family protein
MSYVDFHRAQTTIHVEDKLTIFGTKRNNVRSGELDATRANLCRVFEDDMDQLYLLSLLLTADLELAEKCFVRGLEDSKGSNPVFKEWARSWARRRIVNNAIALIRPGREAVSGGSRDATFGEIASRKTKGLPPELAAVVNLQAFDRFVFVMSVLEGYPERDIRVLLDCSNADIFQARARALNQIGALAQQYGKAENGIELVADVRELTKAHGLGASAYFENRG